MLNLFKGLCGCLLFCCVSGMAQQPVTGDWQGTLPGGTSPLRVVLHLESDGTGRLNGMAFLIDQSPDGFTLTSAELDDHTLNFAIDFIGGNYSGTLSSDGQTISGSWTQGSVTPFTLKRATPASAWRQSIGKIALIPVDKGLHLEVIDWGGTGRPLILLAGLGNTAHIFDKFAPKLTTKFHVLGVTRRGFGSSSTPAPASGNYSADRLGDDILEVIDHLHLQKPILIGHSIAGEELSSIGSRQPEKVGALIYLEAGYAYALYDQAHGDLMIDTIDLRMQLDNLLPGSGADQQSTLKALLNDLPKFEKELQTQQALVMSQPKPGPVPKERSPADAIFAGQQKYISVRVPTLAIFAAPHDFGPLSKQKEIRALRDADLERVTQQSRAFQAAIPAAKVVLIPNADHFIFFSNEAEVLRDIDDFVAALPR